MVPVVGNYQLLAALVPFKTVLKLYAIDVDVPTILGMPVLATVYPQIDW